MFVNRAQELAWLREGWEAGKAQFRILYGRRRVGKSALLDEFIRGQRSIVYQAVEGTSSDQLRDLSAAILACANDEVLRAAPLVNWDQALATFSRMAQSGPLIVVLDEYQYAAESEPALASLLQRWWSRDACHLPIYLILCGSYLRFFVQNVLSGPAYGRNTGSLQLRPLDYREAARFFPSWSHDDHLRAYAVTGGMPYYILQFDPARSLDWNIAHAVLQRGSVLYQDAELLVREELKEPRLYYSILRAIADGCTRMNDIATRVGAHSDLTPYLKNLEALGLVAYRQPLLGKSRRGVWAIVDPYLRFWFRFVLPQRGQIEHGGRVERLYQEFVIPALDQFVSKPTFEEVAQAWVMAQSDHEVAILDRVSDVGAWWGPIPAPTPENPRYQMEAELDVVAVNRQTLVLAGEAKWTRAPIGVDVLNHLRSVVARVPSATTQTKLILFARAFDTELTATAAAQGVSLIDLEKLYA